MNLLGSFNENPHSIVRSGELCKKTDDYGIKGYFISDYPIELELDQQTEKTVSISISYNSLLDSEVTF